METRSKKRTQKEESEVETDQEMEEIDRLIEHGYEVGEYEETDGSNVTEGQDEFIIRPHHTPFPLITDRVPV